MNSRLKATTRTRTEISCLQGNRTSQLYYSGTPKLGGGENISPSKVIENISRTICDILCSLKQYEQGGNGNRTHQTNPPYDRSPKENHLSMNFF